MLSLCRRAIADADRPRAITLGADKGYDTSDFVNELRAMNVRPHVARRLRGTDRVGWSFTFAAAAYNLVRLPKLLMAAA